MVDKGKDKSASLTGEDLASPVPDTGKAFSAELTPMGSVGRIKGPPVCFSEALGKEALTAAQLSKFSFSPENATAVAGSASLVPPLPDPATTFATVSSASSTGSTASSTHQVDGPMGGAPIAEVDRSSLIAPNVDALKLDAEKLTQTSAVNAKVLQRSTSRQGRANQRWAIDEKTNQVLRLVTGCVPIMNDGRILFVSASRKKEWILPKGGWDNDESLEECAIRETYEEAGVLGSLGPKLSQVDYETRKAKKRRLEQEVMMRKKRERMEAAEASSGASDFVHSSDDDQNQKPVTYPISVAPKTAEGRQKLPFDTASPLRSVEKLDETVKACTEEDVTADVQKETHTSSNIDPTGQTPFARASVSVATDDTASVASMASVASEGSHSCNHVRMSLFTLYVSEVMEDWPEKGRLRKLLDIDEAIAMLSSRPEFRDALVEVKRRGLHLVKNSGKIRSVDFSNEGELVGRR